MSLAKTLIKVAIGIAVAKGVSTLVKGAGAKDAGSGPRGTERRPGGIEDIMDGIGGGSSRRRPGSVAQDGTGLDDLLGQISEADSASRRSRPNTPQGGLEDLLGGGEAGGGGGLGDLLGQLAGGGSAAGPRTTRPASGGGQEDLLGQLTGASQPGRAATGGGGNLGGGLGDLLGQLTGGAAERGSTGGGGLGDLLGAVLGGVGGGALAGGVQGSRQQDLAAALILRATVAAVKADGKLDEAEQRKLTQQAEGASREEIAYINAELERHTTVDQLAAQVPEGMEAQIYVMSLMAIDLDNQKEAQYLHSLAQALSLDPRAVNILHDRAGVPHLYG